MYFNLVLVSALYTSDEIRLQLYLVSGKFVSVFGLRSNTSIWLILFNFSIEFLSCCDDNTSNGSQDSQPLNVGNFVFQKDNGKRDGHDR